MRVLFVGDTHGNEMWWARVVLPVAAGVAAEAIVQVGDFGFWSHGGVSRFVEAVASSPVPVFFIDGNHENHPALAAAAVQARELAGVGDLSEPVPLAGNLHYLPRGARWQFGSVRFVALGGAVSIDSPMRTAGLDFFVEEEVGGDDVARVVAGGPADVLVCHDAPAGWAIPNLPPVEWMPLPVAARVDAANRHRVRLRTAYEAVRPAVVVHGHYHSRYRTLVDEAWGQVLVEGLDCDGTEGAFMVMDCTAAPSTAPVHIRFT